MTEDMHFLLGKYFSGEATEEEQQAVKQWAASSEENASEFRLLENLWKASGEEKNVEFNTAKAWSRVDARINSSKQNGSARIIRMAVGIAASLILIAGLWWLLAPNKDWQTVVADVDVKQVDLEDGSHIYLRKGSTLKYPSAFSKNSRQVELEGEAFFDISRDPSRPFSIQAAAAEVEVLGTSFSVNTGNDKVELVVKTGRVRFASRKNAAANVILTAGERALLNNGAISKEANRDENFNAWQSRRLVFKKTSLEEVVRTLNGYYHVNISLNRADSAQLSAAKVTINFNDQPLSSVLKELAAITSYHIEKRSESDYEISIK